MNTKIQIISDIHAEFGSFIRDFINNDVDITIIAGDISSSKLIQNELVNIDQYTTHPILFVPGNHEYYHSQKSVIDKQFADEFFENVIILNNDSIIINDIVFIGGTGWFQSVTDIALSMINDFSLIYDIKENDHGRKWNKECYNFFEKTLDRYKDNKVVCITHNLPSYGLIDEIYQKPPYDAMNCCFAMHWDNLIERYSPALWACGHTHTSIDRQLYNTRVICNPYGYHMRDTNSNFNKNLVIEL